MPVNRRWIKRVIETSKAETAPLPWARKRPATADAKRTELIRTTLRPNPG